MDFSKAKEALAGGNTERERVVVLPPVDAIPTEIAKALFKSKPEGETENPARTGRA